MPVFEAHQNLAYPQLHEDSIPEMAFWRAISKLMEVRAPQRCLSSEAAGGRAFFLVSVVRRPSSHFPRPPSPYPTCSIARRVPFLPCRVTCDANVAGRLNAVVSHPPAADVRSC